MLRRNVHLFAYRNKQ